MKLTSADTAMVGDSVDSDIRGARRVGLMTVLLAPKGGHDGVAHYMVKSMSQLRRLLETYTR
jgi:FMN phosphatase YigB (HAD superfamily)